MYRNRDLLTQLCAFALSAMSVTVASAADITYERIEVAAGGSVNGLAIRGRIQKGDAAKLRALIASDRERFLYEGGWILLDSPGGDFAEALELAELIRKYPSWVQVGDLCASSCFLLYAAGASRDQGVFVEKSIGVHAPFFNREDYARLTMAEAEDFHRRLTERTIAYLRWISVPEPIIERMMRTPSTTMAWLTYDEVRLLGPTPRWFEEFAIARCGLAPKIAAVRSERELMAIGRELGRCTSRILIEERERALAGRH